MKEGLSLSASAVNASAALRRRRRGPRPRAREVARVRYAPVVDPVALHHPLDPLTLVLFALALALALVLTLRRPALGVAFLIVALPFDFSRDAGHTTLTLAKAVLIGVAAALVLRRPSLAVLRSRGALAVGAGAVAIALATGLSIHAADYREPAIRESLKALQYLTLFAVTALALGSDPDDAVLRRAIPLTAAAVSLLALGQLVLGAPSGVWFSGNVIPRIAGPLEGPNQLSAFLGLALPVVLAIALESGDRRLARTTLALGVATLLLTLSRAGVVAGLSALVLVFCLMPRSLAAAGARRGALVAVGAGVASGLAILSLIVVSLTHSFSILQGVLGHFGTVTEVEHAGGVGNRSILWHAAIALWHRHPLLGVGAGNFELEIGRVGPAGVRTHANSLYLQALAEGGVVLLLATVGSVAATLVVLGRAARRRPEALVAGAFCGLAALAAHQIFDLLVFYPKVGDLAWVLTAVAVARIARREPIPEADSLPPRSLEPAFARRTTTLPEGTRRP